MSIAANCTNDTLDELIRDNLLWSISGMLSFVTTTFILLLLVFYKAYTSVLQRLFLYFTIVTLLQLACIAMNIQLQFAFQGEESFCKWLGLVQHWAYMMNWCFSLTLTFYLHFLVFHQIKGKQLPSIGHKKALAIEATSVMVILCLPLTVLWIPFSAYGLNGPLCWTQHLNKDCSKNALGSTFELVYTYCCAVVRLLIVTAFLVLFVIFCRLAFLYRHTRHQYLKTVGRTVFLMFFLIVSALIELVGLLTYIHTAIVQRDSTEVVKKLLEVDYVVLPVTLVITPAGFMVYLYSLQKFSWDSIKRASREWAWCCICCKRIKVLLPRKAELAAEGDEDATAPESNRVSAPSDTYFVVPYTDGFTTISQQEQQSLLQRPPVSSDYDSIMSTAI